jgi:hypothetical protein
VLPLLEIHLNSHKFDVRCLQGRKSDQGPPWLLRQALQPDILASIESSSSTELLHGIYVHLAGSSANIQDLSMHLADMRLGLRCAGGLPVLSQAHRPIQHACSVVWTWQGVQGLCDNLRCE